MTRLGGKWHVVAAALAGLMVVSSAHAVWVFGDTTNNNINDADTSYTGTTDGGASVGLTISGAYAANGGTLSPGALNTSIVSSSSNRPTYGISGFASGATWHVDTSSTLQYYSGNGLGMHSDSTGSNAPNHAIDNGPATGSTDLITGLGNTEAVLLSFGSSVVLSSIGIGYKSGDADISLFRYVGNSAPTLGSAGLATMNASNGTTTGWQLVGNYGDLVGDNSNPYNMVNGCTKSGVSPNEVVTCSSSSKGSSWWLISAYNSAYGAATSGTVDQGNDYFKIYAVAANCTNGSTQANCATTQKTPEPSSLALVALALSGAYGMRRRRPSSGGMALAAA